MAVSPHSEAAGWGAIPTPPLRGCVSVSVRAEPSGAPP
jgi:hypothetical protein